MSYSRGFLAKTAAVIFLTAWVNLAQADFKIVTIGDSLAKGFNADAWFNDGPDGVQGPNPNNGGAVDDTPVPKRSSFRPFLVQTVQNYMNNLPSGPSPVSVDWIGDRTVTEITPAPGASVVGYQDANPNEINPAWRTDYDSSGTHMHGAVGGASAQSYDGSLIDPLINSISPSLNADDEVLALILLGTNDLLRTNHGVPVVTNIGNVGVKGFVSNIIDKLVAMKADTQVLVAGIPPIGDWKTPLDPVGTSRTFNGGFAWTEAGRGPEDLVRWSSADGGKWIAADGNPDDPGAPAPADVNDVIEVINGQMADLADGLANVKYVDALTTPTSLVQHDGSTVDVDGGGTFDLVKVWPEPFPNFENDHLEDGLHLNSIGDQYYAGAFWNQGLRAALSEAIAASAVPEPSSFVFLGLVAVVGSATRRYRRRS